MMMTMTTTTTKLVCIGACYLDTILSVPHYPAEDSKLRASHIQVRRGGNCPNTLEVFQQLIRAEEQHEHEHEHEHEHGGRSEHEDPKVTPHLVTCLPSRDAPATTTIIESFGAGSPIDFSRCIYRDATQLEPARSYIIRSEATGSRTLVNYNGLTEMTLDEFVAAVGGLGSSHSSGIGGISGEEEEDDEDDEDDAWFHFEGRIPETTLQCMQWLRRSRPKARVSVEVEKADREGLEELVAEADVVFYSRSWAENKLYTSAEQCLTAQSAKARRGSHLFCTWGAQGAATCSLPDGATVVCPAMRAGETIRVVDTVGAGDTFIAGILFGFLYHEQDWDQRAKLVFAVQLATCKVQREGFGGLGYEALRRLSLLSV